MAVKPVRKVAAARKAETRIFRATLHDKKSIWREVELRASQSLADLAFVAVTAFGFDFDHAFGFYSGKGRELMSADPRYEIFADLEETDSDALSVEKTKVTTAFPTVGHTLTLLFDYGDEWLFEVKLLSVGEVAPRTRYPRVLQRHGEAPEQYPGFDDDGE